jgi:hypothetical protein
MLKSIFKVKKVVKFTIILSMYGLTNGSQYRFFNHF